MELLWQFNNSVEKRIDFGTNSAGTIGRLYDESIPLTTYTRELKTGQRPKCKTIKLILENLCDLRLGKDL